MADVKVSKGSIVFDDTTRLGGCKIVVRAVDPEEGPITTEKLDTLTDAILAKSECNVRSESVLSIARNGERTFTGNKDRKALLTCQSPDGTIHRWEIPDPKAADCEIVSGTNGQQLKQASADTLAAAFAACTGLTLVALRSPIIQSL